MNQNITVNNRSSRVAVSFFYDNVSHTVPSGGSVVVENANIHSLQQAIANFSDLYIEGSTDGIKAEVSSGGFPSGGISLGELPSGGIKINPSEPIGIPASSPFPEAIGGSQTSGRSLKGRPPAQNPRATSTVNVGKSTSTADPKKPTSTVDTSKTTTP